ncbi:MAG: DNA translocase FtsK 4TM domain-containing protein, partial [Bacillota bacterium]|nr:DNA translocase FtsK 4TM domain-containing protein [Bacillota bacterium]
MSSSRRQNEPIGIVLFFLAIVLALFFYLPAETTGVIGLAIKSLGFGLLGVSAHVIPVFIAYAGIDLFFEKRTRVARMRVKYVIFLMVLISAIFAAFTMDFEYLQSLCFNPTGAKTSAFKACQLLWKSGMDGTLITKADSTINVIPGGLLGGLIATSLQKVCGAIVTRILLFGFTLVQIILIFQISVKSTAKAIGSATKKQISNYRKAVDNRGKPSAHTKGILPESVYNKPGNGTATAYPQPTVVHIPSVQQPVQPVQPVQTVQPAPSMYVNQVVKEVPIIGSEPVAPVIPEYPLVQEEDPFNVHPSLPTDRTTGFIDIGEAADQSTDSIKYGEKQVEINNGYSADFSYTANRKNPALQEKKKADMF